MGKKVCAWFTGKNITIQATIKVFYHCTLPANAPKHGPLPVKLFASALNGPLDNIGERLVKEELACFKEG